MSATDPAVVIPAAAGLIGAMLGGFCAILASYIQVKIQFKQQNGDRRAAVSRQMDGLRVFLKNAKTAAQCTEVALGLRRFFMENPERLSEPENREFFSDYLAVLCERTPPSDGYWTDHRMLCFLSDEDNLKS